MPSTQFSVLSLIDKKAENVVTKELPAIKMIGEEGNEKSVSKCLSSEKRTHL